MTPEINYSITEEKTISNINNDPKTKPKSKIIIYLMFGILISLLKISHKHILIFLTGDIKKINNILFKQWLYNYFIKKMPKSKNQNEKN